VFPNSDFEGPLIDFDFDRTRNLDLVTLLTFFGK